MRGNPLAAQGVGPANLAQSGGRSPAVELVHSISRSVADLVGQLEREAGNQRRRAEEAERELHLLQAKCSGLAYAATANQLQQSGGPG